jgi:hypothetical protein
MANQEHLEILKQREAFQGAFNQLVRDLKGSAASNN